MYIYRTTFSSFMQKRTRLHPRATIMVVPRNLWTRPPSLCWFKTQPEDRGISYACWKSCTLFRSRSRAIKYVDRWEAPLPNLVHHCFTPTRGKTATMRVNTIGITSTTTTSTSEAIATSRIEVAHNNGTPSSISYNDTVMEMDIIIDILWDFYEKFHSDTNYLLIILYVPVIALAVTANILVIAVVFKYHYMRRYVRNLVCVYICKKERERTFWVLKRDI